MLHQHRPTGTWRDKLMRHSGGVPASCSSEFPGWIFGFEIEICISIRVSQVWPDRVSGPGSHWLGEVWVAQLACLYFHRKLWISCEIAEAVGREELLYKYFRRTEDWSPVSQKFPGKSKTQCQCLAPGTNITIDITPNINLGRAVFN